MAAHLSIVSSAARNLWSAYELVATRHSSEDRQPQPETAGLDDTIEVLGDVLRTSLATSTNDQFNALSHAYEQVSQRLLDHTKSIKSKSRLEDDSRSSWSCCELCDRTANTLKTATDGYNHNLAAIMSEPESDINTFFETCRKEALGVSLMRAEEITHLTTSLKANLGIDHKIQKSIKPDHSRKVRSSRVRKSNKPVSSSDDDSGEAARQQRRRKDRVTARRQPKDDQKKVQPVSYILISEVHRNLDSLLQISRTLPQEIALTRSLLYDAIDAREDSIHDAESDTFKWILDEVELLDMTASMSAARSKFASWTRDGGGVFHISGKPGSGKSTLMKFLRTHPKTSADLSLWAGNKRLVTSSFYFWLAGSHIQRELEGLARTVLISVCRYMPHLMPRVFEKHWTSASILDSDRRFDKGLTSKEVEEAFEALLVIDRFDDCKLCVFIDGLDEVMSDMSYRSLAEKLKSWAESNEDVKLCVSARPYQEFLDVFDADQRLHLHDLTSRDVEAFVRSRFDACGAPVLCGPDGEQVVQSVRRKSEGVFVWASIAVRALTELAIRHNADLKSIQQTLEDYDSELDKLYDQLLASLDGEDRVRSEQILLLTACNPFSSPPNALWLSWLDDLDDVNFPPVGRPYFSEEIAARHCTARSELPRLCKGLLELHADRRERKDGDQFYRQRIQWFHRTARDYVQSSARLRQLHETIHPSRLPSIFSCLRLAELVLAGKYRINKGADPRRRRVYSSLLRSMFSLQGTSNGRYQHRSETLQKLKRDIDITRDDKSGGCYIVSNYKSISRRDVVDEDPEVAGSFTHFAANYGQHEYVLSAIQQGEPGILTQSEDLDLVLTAALAQHRWPAEAFSRLVRASKLREIKLRPSFSNDPLASSFCTCDSLLVFATTIALTCLGSVNDEQASRHLTQKKVRKSLALLQAWLDRQQRSMEELICLLQPRVKQDDLQRTVTFFTTFRDVAAALTEPRDTPSGCSASVCGESRDEDGVVPNWVLTELGLNPETSHHITGEHLQDYSCTHVITARDRIAADSALFCRIY